MQDDLNAVYEALFDGPLPAVDGYALTRLNVESLEGIVSEDNLPPNIAFQDRENTFTEDNFVEGEELSLSLAFYNGTDDIETRFRVGIMDEDQFYISSNYNWDTAAWVRDIDTKMSIALSFSEGEIRIVNWGLTTAEPADGEEFESFILNGKVISFRNLDQDDDLWFIGVDDNDVTRVGEDCDITGLPNGHFAIPAKASTELPTAGVDADGIIIIDKTNHRICFYEGGNRYRVNGTAF